MAKNFSRRLFVGGVAAAVGVVAATANAARAEIAASMSIAARVRWCNYRRAIARCGRTRRARLIASSTCNAIAMA